MTYAELVAAVRKLAGDLPWSCSQHAGNLKIGDSAEYASYAIHIGEISGPGSYGCDELTADEAYQEIKRQLPPKDTGDLS
jgi:hypothetical protein